MKIVHGGDVWQGGAPGEYLRWAERRGCPVSITQCWALDAFPETFHQLWDFLSAKE